MPPSHSTPIHSEPPDKPSRGEWVFVFAVVVLAFAFRAAFPSRMAVEHFDEGVYASNIWFDKEHDFRYPARHLFAPPLVPWLLECSQIAFGPTMWAAMLPGVLFGGVTVFLIWGIVRRWFGSGAGLAACSLAAFSDYHVLFSRSALTEPVLCFFLLAGVYCLWRALSAGDFRWAVLAGLTTGLAWSAKYNGWLPIAIGLAGLSAWSIRREKPNPSRGRRFAALGIAALSALVVFYPVWSGLEKFGGYRVVQENHARYLMGLSGWLESASRHLANQRFFDSPLSWFGVFVAVAGFRLVTSIDRAEGRRFYSFSWTFSLALFVAALGMLLGTGVLLGILSLVWLIAYCPWRRTSEDSQFDLAYWLVAAWFVGLLVTTPLYTPYPRLSLPWLISAWILASAAIGSSFSQKLLAGEHAWQQSIKGTVAILLLSCAALAAIGFQIGSRKNFNPPAWQDRAGLARAAKKAGDLARKEFGERAIVYVYAEPAVFYHLMAGGVPASPIAYVPTEPSAGSEMFVAGPHARQSETFQKEWQRAKFYFELVGEVHFESSWLVLSDHFAPAELAGADFSRRQSIQLYRFKSP